MRMFFTVLPIITTHIGRMFRTQRKISCKRLFAYSETYICRTLWPRISNPMYSRWGMSYADDAGQTLCSVITIGVFYMPHATKIIYHIWIYRSWAIWDLCLWILSYKWRAGLYARASSYLGYFEWWYTSIELNYTGSILPRPLIGDFSVCIGCLRCTL